MGNIRLYIVMLNSKIKEFGHEKNNKKENKDHVEFVQTSSFDRSIWKQP